MVIPFFKKLSVLFIDYYLIDNREIWECLITGSVVYTKVIVVCKAMVVKPFAFLFHSQRLNECAFPKIVGKVEVILDATNSRVLGIDGSEYIQSMGVLALLNFCHFINRKNFSFALNGIFQQTQVCWM